MSICLVYWSSSSSSSSVVLYFPGFSAIWQGVGSGGGCRHLMENAHFWRRSHFQLSPRRFHLFYQSNFDGKSVSVLASDIFTKFDYSMVREKQFPSFFSIHLISLEKPLPSLGYFQLFNLFNEDFYVHGVICNFMYNWEQVVNHLQDWRLQNTMFVGPDIWIFKLGFCKLWIYFSLGPGPGQTMIQNFAKATKIVGCFCSILYHCQTTCIRYCALWINRFCNFAKWN